ncbi:MAG: methyltransferase family protein, partial [Anaerolineae bacterium]
VVRHPVYASIDRVALGLAFVNGSTYALLLAVIFVGVWHPIWIAVEERELVHRMGERYASSMRRVPAIWPQGFSGEAKLWQVLTGRDVMSGLPVDVDDEGGRPPSDLPPAGA